MPTLKTIVANLDRAQQGLLRAADEVPENQWKTQPGQGRWSAGEVVGHLITIEKTILHNLDRVVRKLPKSVPFYKRFHVPLAMVESRLIRRKTPIATDDALIREKEEMLSELKQVRKRTLEFIGETMGRDLSKYCMPHPFLGTLNTYTWLQLIASHEVRHTKQMQEIGCALPKVIAIIQK
jgi:uncharacterized damage-inducible protein DinB